MNIRNQKKTPRDEKGKGEGKKKKFIKAYVSAVIT